MRKLINYFNIWKKKRELIKETVKFVERLQYWDDCGCVPCTGICRGPESALISMEAIADESRELSKKWKRFK